MTAFHQGHLENIDFLRQLRQRMIVFGEVHGTNETPELVSAVTCKLAMGGTRVLLALEILDLLNGELADFAAGRTGVDEFLEGKLFWNRPRASQDGRSSLAMLKLLQDIKEYRSRGLLIEPRGIVSVLGSARDNEAMMALNLRTLVTNRPYDYAVVLTGRRHACRKAHRLSIKPRPMAAYLAPDRLYLVRVSFRGGSTWHCPGRGPCGIYDLPAVNDQRPLNRLNQLPPKERRAHGFDAEIVLPRATPSPPAHRHQSGPS